MELELISIIAAKYLGNSTFLIEFNNGEKKRIDISSFLKNNKKFFNAPIFQPLKDETILKKFEVNGTLSWNNGLVDIAPDQLYKFAS